MTVLLTYAWTNFRLRGRSGRPLVGFIRKAGQTVSFYNRRDRAVRADAFPVPKMVVLGLFLKPPPGR